MSEEYQRMFRFSATGALIALGYCGGFLLLRRFGLDPLAANFWSFSAGVLVQYIVQTCWTFRRPLFEGAQTMRFLAVIVFGLVYSSVMISTVAPLIGTKPVAMLIFVCMTMPIMNFLCYRFWVYRDPDPEHV